MDTNNLGQDQSDRDVLRPQVSAEQAYVGRFNASGEVADLDKTRPCGIWRS